jgi:hypothetical protein
MGRRLKRIMKSRLIINTGTAVPASTVVATKI